MILQRLPACVRRLPSVQARQAAMQEAINSALHRVNICPVGEHMSGHRAPRVGVYRDYSRRWYIEARFNEPGARRFEQISMEAIEDMDRVADRCGAIYSED